MKLTAAGKIAIQALLDLTCNSKDGLLSLKEIADRQGISIFFLEQIFRKLRLAGIVYSVRGAGGGYSLAVPPDVILIGHILNAIGESESLFGVEPSSKNPTGEELVVLSVLGLVETTLWEKLNQYSLETLRTMAQEA